MQDTESFKAYNIGQTAWAQVAFILTWKCAINL